VLDLELGDPRTVWLNITNLALGIVTLVCFLVIGWGVAEEVVARVRKRWGLAREVDDHAFVVPILGATMADGGDKVAEDPEE
jgi:hypothetical protein